MITIAFYVESEAYRWMADAAIASARKVMPHARIVQLVYAPAPAQIPLLPLLQNVDAALIAEHSPRRSFLGRYFGLATEVRGDMVLANCDVLFRHSIEHVFNDLTFDIAVPHIASRDVRYDGAMIFAHDTSEAARFWHGLAAQPACWGAERSVNDQLAAIGHAIDIFDGVKRILPGAIYSYVPRSADDPCEGAAVVHYRGPRKTWMAQAVGADPTIVHSYLDGRDATHPGLKP